MYKFKEIYYTIQGEGFHSGKPAVFCRFSGCNLWSGLEKDRESAICKFCDTNFWGIDGENGGKYSKEDLVKKIFSLWPVAQEINPFIVMTGGEPALQLNQELVDYLHENNISIAIETNGTLALPNNIDWVAVSPKADTEIVVTGGNELKLVYPQIENAPKEFEKMKFDHYFLQPLEDANWKENTKATIEYCLKNPKWKLSVQSHKYLGLK